MNRTRQEVDEAEAARSRSPILWGTRLPRSQTPAAGSSPSLTYDQDGNLTSDGTTTYTWDARNQLGSTSGPAAASFSYDASGRRTKKAIAGATTKFLYDRTRLTV